MKRTLIYSLMIALLSMTFLSAPSPAAAAEKYHYDFQKTYQPWVPGAWLYPVTKDTLRVKYEKTAAGLNGFAALTVLSTDAVWMLNAFEPTGNTVTVQFDARRLTATEYLVPIIYVGDGKPSGIGDFQKVGLTLDASWQTYTFETTLKAETIVVALGFMDLHDDPFGSLLSHQGAFDNVTVKISDE